MRYGEEPSQYFEQWPQSGKTVVSESSRVAVLIHGGYWRAAFDAKLMHPIAEHLTSRGWTVRNLEYRRIGEVNNPWEAMQSDICEGLSTVPSDAILIGHSAGGHLALWAVAGCSSGFGGVVALAPVSDIVAAGNLGLSNGATEELLGATVDDNPQDYLAASPRHLLPLGIPLLVVHGQADVNVPHEMSQYLVAAATKAGDDVSFLDLEGVDHMSIIDPTTPTWRDIDEWMDARSQSPEVPD